VCVDVGLPVIVGVCVDGQKPASSTCNPAHSASSQHDLPNVTVPSSQTYDVWPLLHVPGEPSSKVPAATTQHPSATVVPVPVEVLVCVGVCVDVGLPVIVGVCVDDGLAVRVGVCVEDDDDDAKGLHVNSWS
jgi:hypothetical protein